MGPRPLGLERNRWAACVSRQSFKFLTGHRSTGKLLRTSEFAQEKWFQVEPSMHINLSCLA